MLGLYNSPNSFSFMRWMAIDNTGTPHHYDYWRHFAEGSVDVTQLTLSAGGNYPWGTSCKDGKWYGIYNEGKCNAVYADGHVDAKPNEIYDHMILDQ